MNSPIWSRTARRCAARRSRTGKEFNFKPTPLKVLLSMREDYLGDLDYIRSKFRALAQNRLRLRPMGERQAREVIALGASLLAPGAEDRIVKYVAGASANGEGLKSLLPLHCSAWY